MDIYIYIYIGYVISFSRKLSKKMLSKCGCLSLDKWWNKSTNRLLEFGSNVYSCINNEGWPSSWVSKTSFVDVRKPPEFSKENIEAPKKELLKC